MFFAHNIKRAVQYQSHHTHKRSVGQAKTNHQKLQWTQVFLAYLHIKNPVKLLSWEKYGKRSPYTLIQKRQLSCSFIIIIIIILSFFLRRAVGVHLINCKCWMRSSSAQKKFGYAYFNKVHWDDDIAILWPYTRILNVCVRINGRSDCDECVCVCACAKTAVVLKQYAAKS